MGFVHMRACTLLAHAKKTCQDKQVASRKEAFWLGCLGEFGEFLDGICVMRIKGRHICLV